MKLKRSLKHFVLLFILPFLYLSFCGFTATGNMKIGHNGKGNMIMTVESTLSQTEFSKQLRSVINDFNTASGQSDMLKIKEVEKIASGYEVNVQFRRIDKIKTRGEFFWYKAKPLKAKQSMELDKLGRWELGDINCRVDVFYDGLRGSVAILKPREGGPKHVVVPHAVDGKELTVKQLTEKIDGDAQVFLYQNCDTLGVTSVRITFPGKITYYGGENVRIIDESTVKMTPVTLKAKVTKNDVNSLEPIITEEEVNVFVGYVVFDMSISPFLITVIVIACIAVVGVIVYTCISLHIRGKRILAL